MTTIPRPEPTDDVLDPLLERARAGEPGAIDDLVAAVQPMVSRRCSRILPCPPDAEEAAQDALLSIATKLHTFSPGRGSFRGWVCAVASNAARSTYRSLKRRSAEAATEWVPEVDNPRTTSVIAGSRLDLLDAIEALEAEHPVLVGSFVLRDLGALPYAEIAEQLDVPVGTVKAQVHRAREFVRDKIVVKFE